MPRGKKNPVADVVATVVDSVAKNPAKRGRPSAKTQETIVLQVGSSEWDITNCKDRVLDALSSGEKKAAKVKDLQIYIKPEDGKIYYVANGDQNGSIDL